jgi:arylsulfatase A-like enzyme
MEIRAAEPADIERIRAVARDSFQSSYSLSPQEIETILEDVFTEEALSERIADPDALVLVADHGENLGDHGYSGHGRTLYDEEVRVPLVFAHPDIEHATVSDQVRTIDLAPTILELLGVTPPDAFEGRSLLRETNGSTPGDRDVFLTAYPEFTDAIGLRSGGYKLIRQDGSYEFYNLMTDPDERTNLFDSADGPASTHLERLEQWAAESDAQSSQDVSDETREMLRDLGYVD